MSQQAAAALESTLEGLKAKQDDLQSKLADANALVKKTQQLGKLIIEQSDKDEALLQQALNKAKTPAAKAAALTKLNAFLTQSNNELADVQNEINNAKAILQAVQNDITATNNAITNTEQQITKEKASEGQVGPTPTTDPDTNLTEIQGPPVPKAQRQPTVQILDDGSTLTTNADGTLVATPATDRVTSPQSSTILGGLGELATGAAAGLISGALLRKAPANIKGAVGVAAITGAVGLATKALFGNSLKGLTTNKQAAQAAQSKQDANNQQSTADWRVRLSLADDQNYLYNLKPDPGILAPLKATNGVIFPYVPSVSVSYIASYDPTDVTHSNYKIYSYRQSSVESISLTCDFTAQDTNEANYLLAVIHFFRSVTKMFYGRDQNPKPGTPPPLCYLTGLGAF